MAYSEKGCWRKSASSTLCAVALAGGRGLAVGYERETFRPVTLSCAGTGPFRSLGKHYGERAAGRTRGMNWGRVGFPIGDRSTARRDRLQGSQVSKARPGAPFDLLL